jgi:hypothetical protein
MRLLSFVCDRMRDELDMARGAALHAVLDAAQKRLVWFFSSIEQSADRLACSVLLPNDYMTLLWRTCREEDGVRIFDLLHLAETRLGIPLTGRLSERFNPLIMERLPQHIGWDSVIAGRSEQRQLGERVSRRRAELLLKQLWSEFGSVLGAASVQNSTHRSRANAATHGGTFFFGGLECR